MKKAEQIKILASALYEAAQDKKKNDLQKVVDNFGLYLKEKGLMSLMPSVLEELKKIYFEKKNIVQAGVVSKNELSQTELKEIIGLVRKRTERGVELNKTTDNSLLGGIRIRYEDKLLDLSLKNQLNNLKKELT